MFMLGLFTESINEIILFNLWLAGIVVARTNFHKKKYGRKRPEYNIKWKGISTYMDLKRKKNIFEKTQICS